MSENISDHFPNFKATLILYVINRHMDSGKVWNDRFSKKAWETIQRQINAHIQGFYIESIVLSINALKAVITLALLAHYNQTGKSEKNIKIRLKEKKDFGELVNLAKQDKVFTQDKLDEMGKFWNTRNSIVHEFINGKIDYNSLKDESEKFHKLYKTIQDSFIKIRPSEVKRA